LRAAGLELTEAYPTTVDPVPLWDSIAMPEGFASEGPVLQRFPDLVGKDATEIVQAGEHVTAQQYLDAQDARGSFTAAWAEFFTSYDVVLTPSMPVTAFAADRLGPPTLQGRPVPPSFDAWCALALPANLAGLAAVSIPISRGRDGLPVGLQIIGPRWSDATVLRVAAALDALPGLR
jgi:Asp-tRNA(Asn)/Glu-tRNA(Gln) amidotransferase A subunit family amidase